jgi:hypothetical protein
MTQTKKPGACPRLLDLVGWVLTAILILAKAVQALEISV